MLMRSVFGFIASCNIHSSFFADIHVLRFQISVDSCDPNPCPYSWMLCERDELIDNAMVYRCRGKLYFSIFPLLWKSLQPGYISKLNAGSKHKLSCLIHQHSLCDVFRNVFPITLGLKALYFLLKPVLF